MCVPAEKQTQPAVGEAGRCTPGSLEVGGPGDVHPLWAEATGNANKRPRAAPSVKTALGAPRRKRRPTRARAHGLGEQAPGGGGAGRAQLDPGPEWGAQGEPPRPGEPAQAHPLSNGPDELMEAGRPELRLAPSSVSKTWGGRAADPAAAPDPLNPGSDDPDPGS